jgi:hypothetical protein
LASFRGHELDKEINADETNVLFMGFESLEVVCIAVVGPLQRNTGKRARSTAINSSKSMVVMNMDEFLITKKRISPCTSLSLRKSG